MKLNRSGLFQRVRQYLPTTSTVEPFFDRTLPYIFVVFFFASLFVLLVVAPFLFWNLRQGQQQALDDLRAVSAPATVIVSISKDFYDILVRVATAIVQLAGAIVIGLGVYFTRKQVLTSEANLQHARNTLATTQQGQLNDRFSKAIEQLGDKDSITMRLGGIYALEGVARQSDDLYWPVMEVLTGFLREYARPPAGQTAAEPTLPPDTPPPPQKRLPTDIQAVFTVLARRRKSYGAGDGDERERLDLRNTYWRATDLSFVNLAGADLRGADLSGGADLSRSDLSGVDLREADLIGANLSRANLSGANLAGAYLRRAYLIGANLSGANLSGVALVEANMSGAKLGEANLFMADLSGANLSLADLSGANLSGANLTVAQLRSAKTYAGATLSPELLAELEREGMPPA